MSQKRISTPALHRTQCGASVRKVSEILCLKNECYLSNRAIARSCRISHSTVGECSRLWSTASLGWPWTKGLSEAELERLLYPEEGEAWGKTTEPLPDWKEVHEKLKKRHVTLQLLRTEYREADPNGYGYSWYGELYDRWEEKLDPPMRQNHTGGENFYVDYAGDTIPIANPETGEVSQAEIFVGVMGASNYTYAEAQSSQAMLNWIGGHVRAFAYLGGLL